jgi:gas vesicle protein
MSAQKSSNFGVGLLLGAIGGALATLFLTPSTGEESRTQARKLYNTLKKHIEDGKLDEKAQELFGDITEEGKRLYTEVSIQVSKKLETLKDEAGEFDAERFQKFVQDTVKQVGEKVRATIPQMEKLTSSIVAHFDTVEKKTAKAKKTLKPKIKVEG